MTIPGFVKGYIYNSGGFTENGAGILINNFIFDERNLNRKKKLNFP